MSHSKKNITALTEISSADLDDNDVFVIVEVPNPQDIVGFTVANDGTDDGSTLNGSYTKNGSTWRRSRSPDDGYYEYFKFGTTWKLRFYDGEESSTNTVSTDDTLYPWQITNWLGNTRVFSNFIGATRFDVSGLTGSGSTYFNSANVGYYEVDGTGTYGGKTRYRASGNADIAIRYRSSDNKWEFENEDAGDGYYISVSTNDNNPWDVTSWENHPENNGSISGQAVFSNFVATVGLKCWISADTDKAYPWLVASWVKDTEAGTGSNGPTISSTPRTPFQIRKGVASNPSSDVDQFYVWTDTSYARHLTSTFSTGGTVGASLGYGAGYPFIRTINLNGDTEFTNLDGKLTQFQISAGLSNGVAPIKWKIWLNRFQSLIITKKPNDRLFVRKSTWTKSTTDNYAVSANSDGTNVTMHPLNEYIGRDFVVDPIGVATNIAGFAARTSVDNASLVLFSNHTVNQTLYVYMCKPDVSADQVTNFHLSKGGIDFGGTGGNQNTYVGGALQDEYIRGAAGTGASGAAGGGGAIGSHIWDSKNVHHEGFKHRCVRNISNGKWEFFTPTQGGTSLNDYEVTWLSADTDKAYPWQVTSWVDSVSGYANPTTSTGIQSGGFELKGAPELLDGTKGDIVKEVPVQRFCMTKIKKEPDETMFCLETSMAAKMLQSGLSGTASQGQVLIKSITGGAVTSSSGHALKIAYVG